MGFRRIVLSLLLPLLLPVLPAAAGEMPAAELRDLHGRCVMFPEGGEPVALDVPSPCAWVGRAGKRRVVALKDGRAVALVAGPPAHPGDAALSITGPHPQDCSHIGRAVMARDGEIAFGPVLVIPFGFCPSQAPDDKWYWSIVGE